MKTKAEEISSRPFGRLSVFAWMVLWLFAVVAQALPVKTVVQDTLYRADGQVAQGMLTIRWNAFSTGEGEAVPAGELTAKIAADGSIAIPLIPNTGSSPSGGYYTVILKLSDGTTSQEQWVVPVAPTTTVAAVRAKVVPQAVATQFVGRDYVDSAVAAIVPASLMHLAGAEMVTGMKTFSVSPEVPAIPADTGSAVARGYVDQQIGSLATVAKSGSYHDLANQPNVPNLAAPGAIGSVTPGTVNATAYSVNGALLSSAHLSDAVTLAKTNQANTFTQAQTVTAAVTAYDSISKNTPAADIRAYGAKCDGVTDDLTALQSALNASSNNNVLIPGNPNGCYISNPSSITWPNSVALHIQGKLIVGSTFVQPNNVAMICDSGTGAGQFVPLSPSCVLQAPNVYGSLGSVISTGSQTFTPTFTAGAVANLPSGTGITVADTVSCTISSITRAASGTQNVVATLSAPQCRIPSGSTITIAGVTDSTFNGSTVLIAADYPAGTLTWTQSGASASTSSGGTVSGINDDTFESVPITANSGTTITAYFAHAHSSTAVWGAVAFMAKPETFVGHYVKNLYISGNKGAAFWFPHNAMITLEGVNAQTTAFAASIPIELDSSWWFDIHNSDFTTTPQRPSICNMSCGATSYPYGMRLSSLVTNVINSSGDGVSGSFSTISHDTIMGGIKIDANGYTTSAYRFYGLHVSDSVIEQPSGSGIVLDTRYVKNTGNIVWDSTNLQDNFNNYSECLFGWTDYGGGGIVSNNLYSTLATSCIGNKYFAGRLAVNGIDPNNGTLNLPVYGNKTGVLNDGVTLEAELRGEGASMGPSIIPYATANVTTAPTSWTCSGTGCSVTTGVLAPDGSTGAGEIVSGTSGNSSVQVYQASYATATNDVILSGVWCMGGTSTTGSCYGASSIGTPYQVYSYSASDTFDNGSNQYADPGFQSGYTSDWWHPIVSMNVITGAGSGTSHNIKMTLYGPSTASAGLRYWQPFFIYVPYSAKPASWTSAQWFNEIARWRQQLLHGHVSPGMLANTLDIGSSLKLYWGSDTNLYRSGAGTLQTDGNINIGSGKQYQVNGVPISTSNLGDWTNASVANGNVPVWNSSTGKWTPGTVATDPLADPGSNGIVKRIATDTTAPATSSDVVSLFGGGSCSGYLKSDGSCSSAGTGSVVGPASSTDGNVAVFNGATGQVLKDSGVAAASLPSQRVLDFTTTSAPAGAIGANPWIYTLPTGNHICTVYLIGGGAGGGSGAKCSNLGTCYGGGGGGGAPMQMFTLPCSYFGTTITVTVGAGGMGGAAQSSNSASGNDGSNGGSSQITGSPGYGSLSASWSSGSAYGSGGTVTSGSGGSAMGDPGSMFPMCAGASGSSGPGAPEYCVTAMGGPAGGAGGGGLVLGSASDGGMQNSGQQSLRGPAISASTQSGGAAPGGNGQTPVYASSPLTTMFLSAFGGTGGASSCAGTGGKGGDGMFPGGGGGGGGAACNGSNSGAGGKGGDGFVRVIVQ